jgi:predicted dehydrogenase
MEKHNKLKRRDFLLSMTGVPFLGYFALSFKDIASKEIMKHSADFSKVLGLENVQLPTFKQNKPVQRIRPIRAGIIGYGWRGGDLSRAMGYAHPSWVEKNTTNGKYNNNVINYLEQEDLNVEFAGICDTFSVRAVKGVEASLNRVRPGNTKDLTPAKVYLNYREMIADKDIDAVIIATPDHWHARMAIDAAKAGKHVYLEKPMTRTIEEAKELREAIKSSGVIFQLGHQNRQQMSYKMAREILMGGRLGDISLIETYSNRNNDHGAWIRGIDPQGNQQTINWKEFLGDADWLDFDPDRYFNWQKWFEYSGGPTGNQFTHLYDCVNQVFDLGIPESVVALGGLFYYKDPRNIPDVLNVIFNYPQKRLTLTYDLTLKNNHTRNTTFFGTEGTMEVATGVNVYKNSGSKVFKDINVDFKTPFYSYRPDIDIDGISSATSKFYHMSGFGDTNIEGKKYDTTFLHIKEWIDAIRGGHPVSCNIEKGFEESISYILSNIAYLKGTRVTWNPIKEEVIYS